MQISAIGRRFSSPAGVHDSSRYYLKENNKIGGKNSMLKAIIGTWVEGNSLTIHDTKTDNYYHVVVYKDSVVIGQSRN